MIHYTSEITKYQRLQFHSVIIKIFDEPYYGGIVHPITHILKS